MPLSEISVRLVGNNTYEKQSTYKEKISEFYSCICQLPYTDLVVLRGPLERVFSNVYLQEDTACLLFLIRHYKTAITSILIEEDISMRSRRPYATITFYLDYSRSAVPEAVPAPYNPQRRFRINRTET